MTFKVTVVTLICLRPNISKMLGLVLRVLFLVHIVTNSNKVLADNIKYMVWQKSNQTFSFGDRDFAAAGPILWNSLPSHLRDVVLSYSGLQRR